MRVAVMILGCAVLLGCSKNVDRKPREKPGIAIVEVGSIDALGSTMGGSAGLSTGGDSDRGDTAEVGDARDAATGAGTAVGRGAGAAHDPDAGVVPPACVGGADYTADVVEVTVAGAEGAPPEKGEPLSVMLTVSNTGSEGGLLRFTVLLTSERFSDFREVALGTVEATVCPGQTQLQVRGGPFLSQAQYQKEYALGSGDYRVAGVVVEAEGMADATDTSYGGADFTIVATNALLVPVVYDQAYFDRMKVAAGSPEAYLQRTVTRPVGVYSPARGLDAADAVELRMGGFDELAHVRHVFRAFSGYPGPAISAEGDCYDARLYARRRFGLNEIWDGHGTQMHGHGFDYLLALSSEVEGARGCSWLDVAVAGYGDADDPEREPLLVHEALAEVFGAAGCGEKADGEGEGPSGFVLCEGEKNSRYPQTFVWHSASVAALHNVWE